MAVDIVPALNEAITVSFQTRMMSDRRVARISNKIRDGTARLLDGHAFAERAGINLSKALQEAITADALPNATLYYNIAERTIVPALRNNYQLVNDNAAEIQKLVDREIDININSIAADFPEARALGIVDKAASDPDDFARWLREPIVNFTEALFDDYVRENAHFRSRIGMRATITRTAVPGCCEYCNGLSGRWIYGEQPEDVFRRHEFCRCAVTYEAEKMRQNVWSKKQWEATPAEIEARRNATTPTRQASEKESMAEVLARDRLVREYAELAGVTRETARRRLSNKSVSDITEMLATIQKSRRR